MGSGPIQDPKPIIDEGISTYTSGIMAIIGICEVLGREMKLSEPRDNYRPGWGPDGSAEPDMIASWSSYVPDMYG